MGSPSRRIHRSDSFCSWGRRVFLARLPELAGPPQANTFHLPPRLPRPCDSKASLKRFSVAWPHLLRNSSFTNQHADSFLVSGVNLEAKGMNVIVFASRKGGSG